MSQKRPHLPGQRRKAQHRVDPRDHRLLAGHLALHLEDRPLVLVP